MAPRLHLVRRTTVAPTTLNNLQGTSIFESDRAGASEVAR